MVLQLVEQLKKKKRIQEEFRPFQNIFKKILIYLKSF